MMNTIHVIINRPFNDKIHHSPGSSNIGVDQIQYTFITFIKIHYNTTYYHIFNIIYYRRRVFICDIILKPYVKHHESTGFSLSPISVLHLFIN